jgi:hypothetical protein
VYTEAESPTAHPVFGADWVEPVKSQSKPRSQSETENNNFAFNFEYFNFDDGNYDQWKKKGSQSNGILTQWKRVTLNV